MSARFMGLALLAASGATSGCGGNGSTSGTGGEFLTWTNNANGDVVLDANGNAFVFDRSNGCMFSQVTNVGPEGFCLTPSSSSPSGYSPWGPTDCSTPASNMACSVAGFAVSLTNNPSGSGCIAVVTNGTATMSTGLAALSVTETGTGYTIVLNGQPTAFSAYWSGVLPICDGTSAFAGSYKGDTYSWYCPTGGVEATGGTPSAQLCTVNGQSVAATLALTRALSFTIDSGGQINDNPTKLTGGVTANGVVSITSFATACVNGQTCPLYTGSATQSGSKWTLSGTVSNGTGGGGWVTFSATEM